MAPSTEQLRRDLEALRQENARLKGVEAELAAAMQSLRRSEERLRLAVALLVTIINGRLILTINTFG